MSNDVLSVSVSSSGKPVLLGTPVPATFVFLNLSPQPIQILLPYPNPNGLSFQPLSPDIAKPKEVERDDVERTAPIRIDPHSRFSVTYYLNRYMAFVRPGEIEVSYSLSTAVNRDATAAQPNYQNANFSGKFQVSLVPATDHEIREELERFRKELTGGNKAIRTQAAEALAFLDTPISQEYVAPMLEIQGLETIGIDALARHRSAKSDALIVGMISRPDSEVVALALEKTDQLGIPVPRHQVQKLLASDNPGIRFSALKWLARRPERQDLPWVEPLLRDTNEALRKHAQTYTDTLRSR